jgi:hypothetical protein
MGVWAGGLGLHRLVSGARLNALYNDSTSWLYSSTVRPMSRMSLRNRERTMTCLP